MQLFISGKHLDVGESLRTHVADALAAVVERHFGSAMEGKALFAHEGHGFRAHVHVHVARALVVQSHAVASDPYVAFDAALERLETRLKRYKGRFESRHREREDQADAEADSYVLAEAPVDEAGSAADPAGDGAGGKPPIVAEEKTVLLSLSVGDAVARMDLADQAFYLFVNRTHGGLNVVYRRSDGAIGWIDPGPAASARPDAERADRGERRQG
jgi:ribosomal subunit interface protein